ncbi:MAG: YegP family protein [Flavobacteriaceae bacterium]|nr:YegP family protein [Flavobacteriaceae bacterium]
MAKFEIFTDKKGEFRFRLKANNDQIILASEAYNAMAGCTNGIESVRKNSQDDSKFERLVSESGQNFFNLKATNGQVVGTSQMYASSSTMEIGIESVKKNAPDAEVVE